MKKTSLAMLGILLLMASGVSAFEVGENCVENGDFETGDLGSMPAEWELMVSG